MKHRIMIIEDDESLRKTLEQSFKSSGHAVSSYKKGIDAVNAIAKDDYSLAITDVQLPDMNGFNLLRKLKESAGDIPVLLIAANGSIKGAVEAMKHGAFDYITKPFSIDEFNIIAKRALDIRDLQEENIRLKRDLSESFCDANIIGDSPAMQKVFEFIDKVSQSDSTVLITGENGTGKELVATAIHYQSKRRNSPIIKVNCAAFPEDLVESELFGSEKGAYTGADRRKPGRFERADKGTIFLDEIGDLPLNVQVKLLRVLQGSSFERLGGTETLNVDIRVIAATNRNLEEDVKNGRFREDLYYRLNVIPFNIPPLRDRKDDTPLLIDHFLDRCNCMCGKKVSINSDTIMALMDYSFPGNVRELENIVERCVTLSDCNVIAKNSLPSYIVNKLSGQSAMGTLSDITVEAEKGHIIRVLRATKGHKTKAAEILGISRKTLWEKTVNYNINL
jgi:two-component system response regulator AtoC